MAMGVQDICKEKNVSLLELADQTGIELTRVRAIYMARWTPSPAEREGIARVLQTPVEEIAWGHDTPIQHIYGHGPG